MAGESGKARTAAQDDTAPGEGGSAAVAPQSTSWKNLWQIPAILVSLTLIVAGVVIAIGEPPKNDFAGALDQVDSLVLAGELEAASHQLHQVIEPHVSQATLPEQARFHAAVADVQFLMQGDVINAGTQSVSTRVCEHYSKAADAGMSLGPLRLERWAEALIASGDIAGARQRLSELEHMTPEPHSTIDVRKVRNRVFRHLLERSLGQPGLSTESKLLLLGEYRADESIELSDDAWALARQTDLRFESGSVQGAIDLLLVGMRRLEGKATPEDQQAFGELYTQLGRGYLLLGDQARAESQLQHAMHLVEPSNPVVGEIQVLLGQIANSQGDPERAMEQFDAAVRNFADTPAYLPALLGRAEVSSILGDHAASHADYASVAELLPKLGKHSSVTAEQVSASLCDRHDASIALGKLEIGLGYVEIADKLFSGAERVPPSVLFRQASTHRQIADDLMKQALQAVQLTRSEQAHAFEIDPAIRLEINGHYEKAGTLALRHAEAVRGDVESHDGWADSIWLAADSFDMAGRWDRASELFREYTAGRSIEDPRRAEATFRLGQAYQAGMEFAQAIESFEQLALEQPRSAYVARSHVPLARCYRASDRIQDAERELLRVLSGSAFLGPESQDYRDALIELGTMYYDAGNHAGAIERLAEANERYPDDARRLETMFRLADSYRGSAAATREQLDMNPMIAPAERASLEDQQSRSLRTAMELFAKVCDEYGQIDPMRLGDVQQDCLRRSYLYRADCAFTLGDYPQAVELYDRAARRYSSHHSSMYALVQIVNCYARQNDPENAATAHQRALVRLRQLPEESFAASDSLMNREAWEQWLDNSPVAPKRSVSAAATEH